MTKKTRKGIKIGIPHLIEGWYEQEIEEMRKDVKKGRGIGLFKRSKTDVDLNQRFKNFLMVAQQDIELLLWYSKGFAIRNELGNDIDYEFHYSFGRVKSIFNVIIQGFDPDTLSEDLLNHLKRELDLLKEQTKRLWDIQFINPTPEGIEKAGKLLETFASNLNDFHTRMLPYLKRGAKRRPHPPTSEDFFRKF